MAEVFTTRKGSGRLLSIPPAILAAVCGIAAIHPELTGLRLPFILGAVTLALFAFAIEWLFRYRVVVGDDGITIRFGTRAIDLGRPKKLRCGQYERDVIRRGPLFTKIAVPITHVWIALEGSAGPQVLFTATRGMLHKKLDWPTALPPTTTQVFQGNAVGLRAAIGARITAG
jgi:hypothetical protein